MPPSPAHSSPDLSAWRVEPPRDPEFRQRVWARISGARGARETFGTYLRAHAPAVLAALALAILAGAWSGRVEGKSRAARERAAVVTAYVRDLDARAMSHR